MLFLRVIILSGAALGVLILVFEVVNATRLWMYGWKRYQYQPLAEDEKFQAGEALAAYAGIFLGCAVSLEWNQFIGVSIFSTSAKFVLFLMVMLGAVMSHAVYVKFFWPVRRWLFRKWDWPRYMKTFERKSPV